MSNAQDLLAHLKEQKENIKALQEYWDSFFPAPTLNNVQAKAWLDKYPFDTVVRGLDAAIVQLNKRDQTDAPMSALDVIRYASAAMRDLSLSDEEREAKHTKLREAGRKGGQARVPKGGLDRLDEAKKGLKRLEKASVGLDEASKGLSVYGSGSDSVSSSCSNNATTSGSQEPSDASRRAADPKERQKQNNQNTEPTPSGVLGVVPNKRSKPKTASDGTPYPDDFDSWTNSSRLDWLEQHKQFTSSAAATVAAPGPGAESTTNCPRHTSAFRAATRFVNQNTSSTIRSIQANVAQCSQCRALCQSAPKVTRLDSCDLSGCPEGSHTKSCLSFQATFATKSLIGKIAEL